MLANGSSGTYDGGTGANGDHRIRRKLATNGVWNQLLEVGGGTKYGGCSWCSGGTSNRSRWAKSGGTLYYPNTYITVTPGESLTVEHPGGNGAMRIIWGPGRIYPGSPA